MHRDRVRKVQKNKLHFGYDDAPKLFTAMVHKVPLAFQQITAEITCCEKEVIFTRESPQNVPESL
ncbi:MAG: hypothetical protein CL799_08190 [Chromatiales bacterium]|nr:hypothetical protein [Chromatiales bacterium]